METNSIELKKSKFYHFKQTIIMSIVTFFLFILSIFGNFGILGVIIGIRTVIMFFSDRKKFLSYKIEESDSYFRVSRSGEYFFIEKELVISCEKINNNKILRYYDLAISICAKNNKGDCNNLHFLFKGIKNQ